MKSYVGTKIINAEPMSEAEFQKQFKDNILKGVVDHSPLGYHVVYGNKDGEYHSWSPKEVFEEAYRPIGMGEQLLIKKTLML